MCDKSRPRPTLTKFLNVKVLRENYFLHCCRMFSAVSQIFIYNGHYRMRMTYSTDFCTPDVIIVIKIHNKFRCEYEYIIRTLCVSCVFVVTSQVETPQLYHSGR